MTKYLAFDIEIFKPIPDGETDWKQHRPLGMDGAKAPELWQAGEHEKVLEYVGQDVITTLAVAETIERQKGFDWTAKSGRLNSIRINTWLSVKDALALPEPDTSWMADPWPRSKFSDWMHR